MLYHGQLDTEDEYSFHSKWAACYSSSFFRLQASSEMYYTEEAFAINDRGTKCLPSFSSPVHCMEMCRNWEDITFQSLELDASSYGGSIYHWMLSHLIFHLTVSLIAGAEAFSATIPPPICRQGSEGEEANLWLQEDNIVTVMWDILQDGTADKDMQHSPF